MARQIYALLPATDGGQIDVAVPQGREWQILSIEHYKPQADDSVFIFAPSTVVTAHRSIIVARTEREAVLSAPYTIEDELAQPVELLHFALGPRVAPGEPRDLYVVDSAQMERWVGRLKDAGLGAAVIVPELSLLPEASVAIALGDRCLIAANDRRYGVDLSLPEDVVRALLSLDNEPLGVQETTTHPLLKLIEWARDENLVDIRQGRFAMRRPGFSIDFRSLSAPMALASVSLVGWLSYLAFETATLSAESSRLRMEASSQYSTVFPDEQNVADPAQRIRERNTGYAAPALEFQTGAAALYEAVLAVDGAQIRSLRYDGMSGVMRASISYAAYGDDAKLRQAMANPSLLLTIGDSRQEQGRVIGDVTLEVQK